MQGRKANKDEIYDYQEDPDHEGDLEKHVEGNCSLVWLLSSLFLRSDLISIFLFSAAPFHEVCNMKACQIRSAIFEEWDTTPPFRLCSEALQKTLLHCGQKLGSNCQWCHEVCGAGHIEVCRGIKAGEIACCCPHGSSASDGTHIPCCFGSSGNGTHIEKCSLNNPAPGCYQQKNKTPAAPLDQNPSRIRGNPPAARPRRKGPFVPAKDPGPAGHGKNGSKPFLGAPMPESSSVGSLTTQILACGAATTLEGASKIAAAETALEPNNPRLKKYQTAVQTAEDVAAAVEDLRSYKSGALDQIKAAGGYARETDWGYDGKLEYPDTYLSAQSCDALIVLARQYPHAPLFRKRLMNCLSGNCKFSCVSCLSILKSIRSAAGGDHQLSKYPLPGQEMVEQDDASGSGNGQNSAKPLVKLSAEATSKLSEELARILAPSTLAAIETTSGLSPHSLEKLAQRISEALRTAVSDGVAVLPDIFTHAYSGNFAKLAHDMNGVQTAAEMVANRLTQLLGTPVLIIASSGDDDDGTGYCFESDEEDGLGASSQPTGEDGVPRPKHQPKRKAEGSSPPRSDAEARHNHPSARRTKPAAEKPAEDDAMKPPEAPAAGANPPRGDSGFGAYQSIPPPVWPGAYGAGGVPQPPPVMPELGPGHWHWNHYTTSWHFVHTPAADVPTVPPFPNLSQQHAAQQPPPDHAAYHAQHAAQYAAHHPRHHPHQGDEILSNVRNRAQQRNEDPARAAGVPVGTQTLQLPSFLHVLLEEAGVGQATLQQGVNDLNALGVSSVNSITRYMGEDMLAVQVQSRIIAAGILTPGQLNQVREVLIKWNYIRPVVLYRH